LEKRTTKRIAAIKLIEFFIFELFYNPNI